MPSSLDWMINTQIYQNKIPPQWASMYPVSPLPSSYSSNLPTKTVFFPQLHILIYGSCSFILSLIASTATNCKSGSQLVFFRY